MKGTAPSSALRDVSNSQRVNDREAQSSWVSPPSSYPPYKRLVASVPEKSASKPLRAKSPADSFKTGVDRGEARPFPIQQRTESKGTLFDVYIDWINLLVKGANVTAESLPFCLKNGILLCRLLGALDLTTDLSGVNYRPLSRAACISNLEIALQALWKAGAKASRMPTANDLYSMECRMSWNIVHQLFNTYVIKDSLTHWDSVLMWFINSVAAPCGMLRHLSELSSQLRGSEKFPRVHVFGDGALWIAATHNLLAQRGVPSSLTEQAFSAPTTEEEVTSNLGLFIHTCLQFNLPLIISDPQLLQTCPARVIIAQCYQLYKACSGCTSSVSPYTWKDSKKEPPLIADPARAMNCSPLSIPDELRFASREFSHSRHSLLGRSRSVSPSSTVRLPESRLEGASGRGRRRALPVGSPEERERGLRLMAENRVKIWAPVHKEYIGNGIPLGLLVLKLLRLPRSETSEECPPNTFKSIEEGGICTAQPYDFKAAVEASKARWALVFRKSSSSDKLPIGEIAISDLECVEVTETVSTNPFVVTGDCGLTSHDMTYRVLLTMREARVVPVERWASDGARWKAPPAGTFIGYVRDKRSAQAIKNGLEELLNPQQP